MEESAVQKDDRDFEPFPPSRLSLTLDQLYHQDALQLRMEAECLFYEYLLTAGIVLNERDYIDNFRSVFSAFIQGELDHISNPDTLDLRYKEELTRLHASTMNNSKALSLYIFSQARALAYLIKTGRLKGATHEKLEEDYAQRGFDKVFAFMSTGGLTMKPRATWDQPDSPDGPMITAFPDFESLPSGPAATSVPVNNFGVRLRVAANV